LYMWELAFYCSPSYMWGLGSKMPTLTYTM
jgi:hypothetical protein